MDEPKPGPAVRGWLEDRIAFLKARYIRSFWGAAAAFFLLQIFGYILFNAFVLYSESLPVFMDVPSCMSGLSVLLHYSVVLGYFALILILIGGFIDFQGRALNNISDFFSQNRQIAFPGDKKEAMKLIISAFFLIAFIYIVFFPPLPGAAIWQLALFYVFCWGVSIASKKRYLQPTESRTIMIATFLAGLVISLIALPNFSNWSDAAATRIAPDLSAFYCMPLVSPSNLIYFITGLAMITESLVSALFSG